MAISASSYDGAMVPERERGGCLCRAAWMMAAHAWLAASTIAALSAVSSSCAHARPGGGEPPASSKQAAAGGGLRENAVGVGGVVCCFLRSHTVASLSLPMCVYPPLGLQRMQQQSSASMLSSLFYFPFCRDHNASPQVQTNKSMKQGGPACSPALEEATSALPARVDHKLARKGGNAG